MTMYDVKDPSFLTNWQALAEQSIFTQIEIRKGTTELTPFQEKAKSMLPLFDQPLNNVETERYYIANLPPSFPYVPRNSIYSAIPYLGENDPDFRFVKIKSGKNLTGTRVYGNNMELLVEKVPDSMYVDPLPTLDPNDELDELPQMPVVAFGNTNTDELISNNIRNPLVAYDTAVRILEEDWVEFKNKLSVSNNITDFPPTAQEVFYSVVRHIGISPDMRDAVMSSVNQSVNPDTLKIGVAHALVYKMKNSEISNMSEEMNARLADSISKKVDQLKN